MNSDISKLFKAYDIRGTYPEVNETIAYWTAYGLVETILKPENLSLTVAIMHDCRLSSPQMYAAVVAGITDAGGTPECLGLGTTDLLYAATMMSGGPGIMITASHNPKDDNGMKIVKQAPQMLGLSAGLGVIRDFVIEKMADGSEIEAKPTPVESEKRQEVFDFYISKMKNIGQIDAVRSTLQKREKPYKAVVDCGNGMGSVVAPLLEELYPEIEFIKLYWEPDGNYPNHPADPSNKANLVDAIDAIAQHGADVGIAFDGDADRAYFIDETGRPVDGNYIAAGLTKSVLEKQPEDSPFNPAVCYSMPQSRIVPHTTLENNGIVVPCKQGHTYIKENMKKYNAIFGGEGTGHYYFGEFGYMDGGAITVAAMLDILINEDIKPSAFVDQYEHTYHLSGEINTRLEEGVTFETLKAKIQAHYTDAAISEMDGITVYYHDWKVNLRASNTEPIVRLNIETIGENKIEEKKAEIYSVLGW